MKKSFITTLKFVNGETISGSVNYFAGEKYSFVGKEPPHYEFEFIVLEPGHRLKCTSHSPNLKVDLRMMTDIYFKATFNALPDQYTNN